MINPTVPASPKKKETTTETLSKAEQVGLKAALDAFVLQSLIKSFNNANQRVKEEFKVEAE